MSRRYLIDENTTPALADQLRRRQPDIEVASVGDSIAPPKERSIRKFYTGSRNMNLP